jgi:hypothetical protein
MTPKEKAKELVDKFNPLSLRTIDDFDTKVPVYKGKECALFSVGEILATLNNDIRDLDVRGNVLLDLIKYWREVKQEIEKL